ncbi:MAG TPA: GMC family oxidoreductase [Actinomycetota bacterium]
MTGLGEPIVRPDVIVIGAGGTGAVVAKELAETGLYVLVLEAGRWHDPGRDFTGLEWDMLNPFDGLLRWGPSDRSKRAWPRVRDGIGLLFQTAGVGGNTLHFGGNCPRAYPASVDDAWPIRYGELVPYYRRVEATLPVGTAELVARKEELFIRGCEAIGFEHAHGPDVRSGGWRMQPNAIASVARAADPIAFPAARGCTQCGECLIGCRNPDGAPVEQTAKRGTNASYAPLARATGRCEFRTGCFVTGLVTEDAGERVRIKAVRYRTEAGERNEVEAKAVVLACGAIETPRLWLSSGLPASPAVGSNLTTHWFDYVSGVMPGDVEMNQGQTSMARADLPGYGFIEVQGFGPLTFALATSMGPATDAPGAPDGPWAHRGRTWGATLKRRMEAYRRTLTIAVCVDDENDPSNGVTLSDRADEHGPVPVVRYHATPATIARRDWLARRAAEVLVGAGADPASIHRADALPSTIHMHGTMRMGFDPATSVVDPEGEAHAVERLFIADTSVFVNGIGGPNPTLTAQAIATRTAGHLARRYFGS